MRFLPIVTFVFLTFLLPFAMAHDPNHPELNGWFKGLHSAKAYCCAETDGVKLANVDWKSNSGHYQVRIHGDWYTVPDDAVLTVPNLDGETIVWAQYTNGIPYILCFIPGAGG